MSILRNCTHAHVSIKQQKKTSRSDMLKSSVPTDKNTMSLVSMIRKLSVRLSIGALIVMQEITAQDVLASSSQMS